MSIFTSADGHARFSVLTPAVIRCEWSPSGGQFEDRASTVFVSRLEGEPGDVATLTEAGVLSIETSQVKLTYKEGATGNWDDRLCIVVKSVGTSGPVSWVPGQFDSGNLKGTCRTLDNISGGTNLHPGLISRDGWVVVDDSETPVLDGGSAPASHHLRGSAGAGSPPAPGEYWEGEPWPAARKADAAGRPLDWYFLGHGHNYTTALKEYTYTDTEFQELIGEFRANDVPVDVLVCDMDWHLDGWTGYSWNPTYFKDPPKFLEWAKSEGLSVTLNLHPADGVASHETAYEDVCKVTGTTPPATVPFNCLDKKYMDAYFRQLHQPIEAQGLRFWWIDWQQGSHSSLHGLDPLFWLNHLHWVDMLRNPANGGQRPLILSRWGGLGNHRYQVGFSGDTHSNWKSLTFQVAMTATAGNVCYPFWSHDIGGHFPGSVEPELYVRWIQWAAFNPMLRTHSTRSAAGERRIWTLPTPMFHAARAAFHLRYSLLSYIYTTARGAYDSALPLNRPLYYAWPEREEAYGHDGVYMFGDNLLCSPVTSARDETSGLATVNVWFPPGDWYHWFTGRRYSGPGAAIVAAPLEEVPVFAKAGSITPVNPKVAFSRQATIEPLQFHVFPGDEGAFTLYEDDGDTVAYTGDSGFVRTPVTMSTAGNTVTIVVGPAVGACETIPTHRNFAFHLRETWPATSAQAQGLDATAAYDAASLSSVVTATVDTTVATTITINLSTLPVDALREGLHGQLATLSRVVAQFGADAPPELVDAQELVQAVFLSCEGDASSLPESLNAVLRVKSMFGNPLPGRQAAAMQLMASADTSVAVMVERADPDVCRCRDLETGAFLPVPPGALYMGKWVKGSGGVLQPSGGGKWAEQDDDGNPFANFEEVSRQGNCRKCMTLHVYDASRCMHVRATPDEFAWSSDAVQWNTISSGRWVSPA